MNGLGEIQGYIKNFICEKENIQRQIAEIEARRTQLAQQRNEKKKEDSNCETVNQLGREISELGNQSQELQKQLDFKSLAIKSQINLVIDNSVAEGIRKIRIIDGEINELQEKNEKQKERNAKYQLQRQEFYVRFGRMPELSDRAEKASKLQEKETEKNELEIQILKQQIVEIQDEIAILARTKRDFKNGNWNSIIESEEKAEEIYIEELTIEEMDPIEEIYVEEFESIEEIYVEEFEPIEELYIEEFTPVEEIAIEEFEQEEASSIENVEVIAETQLDEIEKLARSIVEQIVEEQTANHYIEEEQPLERTIEMGFIEDGITFEQESEKKEKVIIPLFGQRATISNIIIKFEDGNLVYKAQMIDDDEVKIYPANLGVESVLLRDKQNREECKEILINYAVKEHKILDKKVVEKIDPLVCELLIECAERYGHDALKLVYNYAESFVDSEIDSVPGIVYNLSYIEQSNLSRKEKAILNKICKNARKNNKIDVIESFSGFKRVKYLFKRLFAINNIKVLPEAKY